MMYVFPERNGYRLEASEAEAVEAMLALAAGEIDEKPLSAWLEENCVPAAEGQADPPA